MTPQVLEFDRFLDDRGDIQRIWLSGSYAAARNNAANGSEWPRTGDWCQENVAISKRGVLRGIHGNMNDGNWTIFTILYGQIFFVVVDCTEKNFGHVVDCRIIESKCYDWITKGGQCLIPPGYGRAYYVESEVAVVHYKWTTPYEEQKQFTYRYDDPRFGIIWPFKGIPVLSARDSEPL